VRIGASLRRADGAELPAETCDFSMTGLGLRLHQPSELRPGERCEVLLHEEDRVHALPVQITQIKGLQLGVEFLALTPQQESQLVRSTFGHPALWLDSRETTPDQPLHSLWEVMSYGLRGYARLLDRAAINFERSLRQERRSAPRAG
jgi:cellulose synthase (UDP-forming)